MSPPPKSPKLPKLPPSWQKTESSAAQAIANLIRDEIGSGRLPQGAKLPSEQELVAHFGTSRPTCREALRILQSEGLLVVTRGNNGGARVLTPQPERLAQHASLLLKLRKATLHDTFEVRELIEPAAVAHLAANANKALSKLAQIAAGQKYVIGDRAAFAQYELEFRRLLLDSCNNEPLRLIGLVIDQLICRQLDIISKSIAPHEFEIPEEEYAVKVKEELIELIAKGEASKAADLWRNYLQEYQRGVMRHGGKELLL
jgi:DNA-binding FadR family transcriptional regulator